MFIFTKLEVINLCINKVMFTWCYVMLINFVITIRVKVSTKRMSLLIITIIITTLTNDSGEKFAFVA